MRCLGRGLLDRPDCCVKRSSYVDLGVCPQWVELRLLADLSFHFYFNRALTIQSQATMDLTWGLSFSKASKPV